MGYLATDTGGGESTFEPVSPGSHSARCVRVVDLGTQKDEWQGDIKFRDKVYLGFEVPDETATWTDKDGNEQTGPKMIGATLTLNIGDKSTLGQWLVNWRGKDFTAEERKGFDIFNVLGKPCLLTVAHKAKRDGSGNYAKITGISGLVKGMTVPEAVSDLIAYSPEHPTHNSPKTLEALPKWMRDKMAEAVNPQPQTKYPGQEYVELPPPDNSFDDDIPF